MEPEQAREMGKVWTEGEKSEKLIEMLADDESCSIEETMTKVDKVQEKMKYKAF